MSNFRRVSIRSWHILLAVAFSICVVTTSVIASKPTKLSHDLYDYYVLEHNPAIGVSIEECAESLGAEVVDSAGELHNHWLLRRQKNERSTRDDGVLEQHKSLLQRRDPVSFAIKHLSRQTLRQRVKRAALPAPAPQSPDDTLSLTRDIAERLGIEDPLFKDQWHLINEEYPEHMVNAAPVWDMGITGKDVVSCIIDDGLEYESEDLADNFDAAGSYDFNDHTELPKPRLRDDHHGTRCAGQIAAVKNGVCGVGIAYDSKVAGVRILSGPISDIDEATALNFGYQNTSIYSCSWGPPDDGRSMDVPSILVQKAMLNGVQRGRDGLGSVFVFASGNGANSGDQCNFDGYTNSIYSVTVASIDYQGQHPYYSEACAANMVTTYSSGFDRNKHIVTTDIGRNKCTRNHGGTSAAAPNAVGIFALALSARPDLTWRDIQYLCVKTAQIVNPEDPDWEPIASGQLFSYKYGFGKLDALKFVKAAQEWSVVKPQTWIEAPAVQLENGSMDSNGKYSGGLPIAKDGIQSTLEITQDMIDDNNFEDLEHVTIRVWIDHTRRGAVEVSLVSPNGIRSVLAGKRNSDFDRDGFPGWRFMSVKHWGENPLGTWTLHVSDQNAKSESGSLIGWSLSLWGSSKDASKAQTYVLKASEELPIPFPPVVEDPIPDPDSTTLNPSTTKQYQKPTVTGTSVSNQDDTESTQTGSSGGTSEKMSDDTRHIIVVVASIFTVLLIGFGAFLIIRQLRQNRRDALERNRSSDNDVRMRLLDSDSRHLTPSESVTVLYDEEDEGKADAVGPSDEEQTYNDSDDDHDVDESLLRSH